MNLVNCDVLSRSPDRMYGGATGSKIAVKYAGLVWMLKRQQSLKARNMKNVEISYANDPITEHIGSRVYAILGLPVHLTLLGTYHGRLCVLCKDLTYPDSIVEFKNIRNTLMEDDVIQHSSGMSSSLKDIFEVLDTFEYINKDECYQRFWDMFVVDSLIGNTDRNNGNWGFTKYEGIYRLAPVYDCGGCLNNKRSESQMLKDMQTQNINQLAINYVVGFKNDKGKSINPFHYMHRTPNKCMLKMLSKINECPISNIRSIVESVKPVISDIQAEFYIHLMDIRRTELCKIYGELKDLYN